MTVAAGVSSVARRDWYRNGDRVTESKVHARLLDRPRPWAFLQPAVLLLGLLQSFTATRAVYS
jgi:hypothetical protein